MDKEELIEVLSELYDARKEAKEYLDYWVSPDPDMALEDNKALIDKMFFYSTGKNRSQPAANELKRVVRYFSLLVFDSEKIADLMIHIAERQYVWASQKTSGILQTETAVRRAYDNARIYVEGADLESLFGLRLKRLIESIDEFYRNPPGQRSGWWRRRRY